MNQLGDYGGSNNVVRGLKTGGFAVMGQTPDIIKIEARKIVQGRFLNENDLTEKRKVAVIGIRVYEVLYSKRENPIGTYIKINGVNFKVIGLTEPLGTGQESQEQAEQINIPFTTFQNAFNYGNRVGWFAIKAKDNVLASVAEQQTKAVMKERHKIAPDDRMAIGSWNAEEEFQKLNGLFSGIEILVWVVGIGTLFAGIIGVSNIMLIVVKERTKEIGVKRALGATPFQITTQIMLESLFLTAFAGYFGMSAGVWLLEAIGAMLPPGGAGMFDSPDVDLNIVMKAWIILIFSGMLAGLIPANRAVSISPVEALRNE
jgi:putative ABC transport system permease protein